MLTGCWMARYSRIVDKLPKNHVTLTYMSIASRRKKAMMRLIVKMQQPGLSGGGSSTRMWIRRRGSGPASYHCVACLCVLWRGKGEGE